MPATRSTVLILSTNPSFAREIANHWPADSTSPEFIVLEENIFRDSASTHFDLAIADASSPGSQFELKKALASSGKPAILVHADSSLPFSHSDGIMIELRGQDGLWSIVAGLLGREILGRRQAEARAREAANGCAAAQAEATLGRYMVEMRHNANNALTSVLGNAELLTLEPGLPASVLAGAETILNMALRLNEIFQRFSSLEKELCVAARESGRRPAAYAAVSGK
jgi:signal transduction histidine kinase